MASKPSDDAMNEGKHAEGKFDRFLRESAPEPSPNPDHRRHLRQALSDDLRSQRRRRRLPWLVSALAGLALIAIVAHPGSRRGIYRLESESIDSLPGTMAPLQTQLGEGAGHASDIWHLFAREKTVQHGGREREAPGLTDPCVQRSGITHQLPNHQLGAFIQGSALINLQEQIQDGSASYLGSEDSLMDGITVKFQKWSVATPTGRAIYRQKKP